MYVYGMFNLKKIVFIFIYVVEKVGRIDQTGSAFQRLSMRRQNERAEKLVRYYLISSPHTLPQHHDKSLLQ